MSHTQAWLGKALSNCLANTLFDTGMVCLLSVVCTNLRLQTGRNPLARIRLRTPVASHRYTLRA